MSSLRWSEEEWLQFEERKAAFENHEQKVAAHKAARANKYRAQPLETGGERFDSKHEYRCYQALRVRQDAGEITGLRRQVKFSLFDAGGFCRGEHVGIYRCDFTYREGEKLVVADAKSEYTRKLRDWQRTKKLLRMCHGHEVVEM